MVPDVPGPAAPPEAPAAASWPLVAPPLWLAAACVEASLEPEELLQ